MTELDVLRIKMEAAEESRDAAWKDYISARVRARNLRVEYDETVVRMVEEARDA
jgi:hypothetical protein